LLAPDAFEAESVTMSSPPYRQSLGNHQHTTEHGDLSSRGFVDTICTRTQVRHRGQLGRGNGSRQMKERHVCWTLVTKRLCCWANPWKCSIRPKNPSLRGHDDATSTQKERSRAPSAPPEEPDPIAVRRLSRHVPRDQPMGWAPDRMVLTLKKRLRLYGWHLIWCPAVEIVSHAESPA